MMVTMDDTICDSSGSLKNLSSAMAILAQCFLTKQQLSADLLW